MSESLDFLEVEAKIVEALKTVYDPEIPVNVYDLGLIYDIRLDGNDVEVDMTLTSPGCPVGSLLLKQVKRSVMKLEDVNEVEVNLVFDPPWDPARVPDEVKLELGIF